MHLSPSAPQIPPGQEPEQEGRGRSCPGGPRSWTCPTPAGDHSSSARWAAAGPPGPMGWTEHRSFQSYRCSFEGEIFWKTIQVSWPWADSQTGLIAGILQIIHGNAFGWHIQLGTKGPPYEPTSLLPKASSPVFSPTCPHQWPTPTRRGR